MNKPTLLMESVIEIAWIFDELMECGKIKSWDEIHDIYYDSVGVKMEIIHIAKKFESQYQNIDWNDSDLDYVIELDKFARQELIQFFGKEV